MKKISLAEFGRYHRLSRNAAWRWKQAGHLVMDGALVVFEESNTKLKAAGLGRYANYTSPSRSRAPQQPNDAEHDEAPDIGAFVAKAEDLDDENLTRFVADMALGRTSTMANASTIKENALALKHTLQALQLQGKSIEVAVAEQIFFEEFRSCRDAWLNFPSRIGPILAADLGIETDRLVEALTVHVHQQLNDLGVPEVHFESGDASGEQIKTQTDHTSAPEVPR